MTAADDDGPAESVTLGVDILAGQVVQAVVPAHHWQAAETRAAVQGGLVARQLHGDPGLRFRRFHVGAAGLDARAEREESRKTALNRTALPVAQILSTVIHSFRVGVTANPLCATHISCQLDDIGRRDGSGEIRNAGGAGKPEPESTGAQHERMCRTARTKPSDRTARQKGKMSPSARASERRMIMEPDVGTGRIARNVTCHARQHPLGVHVRKTQRMARKSRETDRLHDSAEVGTGSNAGPHFAVPQTCRGAWR